MLAKPVLGDHVGEWSTKGGRATLATDDVLNKAVDIARLQVPPRAPEKLLLLLGGESPAMPVEVPRKKL